jgi:hypothetical protein
MNTPPGLPSEGSTFELPVTGRAFARVRSRTKVRRGPYRSERIGRLSWTGVVDVPVPVHSG